MATFNLIEELGKRRELVIAEYNKLSQAFFFDGISLKNFMYEVINACNRNGIRSVKMLDAKLNILIDSVKMEHSKSTSIDVVTENLRKEYKGTAYMALV